MVGMANLLDIAGQFIMTHYAWRHLIIALGILIQGELTVLLSMYLILNNYLGWGGFFLSVAIGLFAYESFFYLLGKYFKDTALGKKIEKKIPHHAKMQFYLHKNATLFLILSKFVVYFNLAILLLSGWTKMSSAKFFKHRLVANAIWLGLNGFIYFFVASGYNLLSSQKILHRTELGVFAVIILIIFGSKYFLKRMIEKGAAIEEGARKIGEAFEKENPPSAD